MQFTSTFVQVIVFNDNDKAHSPLFNSTSESVLYLGKAFRSTTIRKKKERDRNKPDI